MQQIMLVPYICSMYFVLDVKGESELVFDVVGLLVFFFIVNQTRVQISDTCISYFLYSSLCQIDSKIQIYHACNQKY